jgi:excisionase family DNA binding protein
MTSTSPTKAAARPGEHRHAHLDGSSLLTAHEAADLMRCHEKTVRRMIQRGELRAVKFAGRWLLHPSDLPTASTPLATTERRHRPRPRGRITAIAQGMARTA